MTLTKLSGARVSLAPLVRDALVHLHDPVALQRHPLGRMIDDEWESAGRANDRGASVVKNGAEKRAGARLRRGLEEGIAQLRPAEDTGVAGAARGYRLLQLRYVEALEPAAVQDLLGVSHAQYYRDHAQALDALVSLLAERWKASGGSGLAVLAGAVLNRLTSFIGRDQELDEVAALLAECRLLTVTGPGGSGKTRLALAAAERAAADFAGGGCVVDLAPLGHPALVGMAIAKALGVRETPGTDVEAALAQALNRRHLLLVLDNFEHLLESPPDGVTSAGAAPLVGRLVARCARLSVLATSRTRLRLAGERVYPLGPFMVPEKTWDADQVERSEAVQLFVDRAREANPRFVLDDSNRAAVADICRRLDGLPLAIELAAAHTRLLSPNEMLALLGPALPLLSGGPRDAPERQRTMRDTIAWSYRLLSGWEQALIRQLALFRGFTLAAAIAVAADDRGPAGAGVEGAGEDVLIGVLSLAEHNLLTRDATTGGEPRFQMLETVREYALERLEESGEMPAARDRHAAHFVRLADEAAVQLTRSQQSAWLNRLEEEHDNIREALAWLLSRARGVGMTASDATDAAKQYVRLSGALWRFWTVHLHIAEGSEWLEEAVVLSADEIAAAPGSRACLGAGVMAFYRRDWERAQALTEEALRMACEAGDDYGRLVATVHLGIFVRAQEHFDDARWLFGEALELARRLGDTFVETSVLTNLARLRLAMGDSAGARALFEQAVAMRRPLHDEWGLAGSLTELGTLALREGDLERAAPLIEEGLQMRRALGNHVGMVASLKALGDLARVNGDLGAAIIRYEEALQAARQFADPGSVAACLEGVGMVLAARGDNARAARLLSAAEVLFARVWYDPLFGVTDREPAALQEIERLRSLQDPAVETAWAEGTQLAADVEAALESALSVCGETAEPTTAEAFTV